MTINGEQKILQKISTLNQLYLKILEFTLEETTEIDVEISKLDNNYFVENPSFFSEYKRLFSNDSLHKLKNELNNLGDIIDSHQTNLCNNHEWIDDTIDIDCEKSMCITYCTKCETSKKHN